MSRFSVRDIFRNRNSEDNSVPDYTENTESGPMGGEEDTELTPVDDMPPEDTVDIMDEGESLEDPMGNPDSAPVDYGDPETAAVTTPTYPSTLGAGTFSLPGSKTFRQYQQKRTSRPGMGATSIAGDDLIGKRLRGQM